MSYDPLGGYIPSAEATEAIGELPIFTIEHVQLQFPRPSGFVAAQVSNNAIILAFANGRILRIDLEDAGEIEDIDLPKKTTEVGTIRALFLDPTASHLLITTTLGENFYLHSQSKTPKLLSRFKGVYITSVAWNPSQPTASTRKILIAAGDGNLYETFIEPQPEFYRREEKYVKNVYKAKEGSIVGVWADTLSNAAHRRVLLATPSRLLCWTEEAALAENDSFSYARMFDGTSPAVKEISNAAKSGTSLVVSPETHDGGTQASEEGRTFAWLCADGVLHGSLPDVADSEDTGEKMLSQARIFKHSQLPTAMDQSRRPKSSPRRSSSVVLTQWHMIQLVDDRIIATNRLDDTIVLNESVLKPGQSALGLFSDPKKNTFWLFTNDGLFEIRVEQETRHVWKILLAMNQFDAAARLAKTTDQKNAVAIALGDRLVSKKQYLEAATVYGRCTKPFEQVALTLIDDGQHDALRSYLVTKLSTLDKKAVMQRIMLATWLIELYMSKLNLLDDTLTTKAELVQGVNPGYSQDQLSTITKEYQDFVSRYKNDLDVKTVYEIISSHGREEELLYFAVAVNDYNYVLSYWVQRERWQESLGILQKQTDANIFYKYSSVLMANAPNQLVDILMRQTHLEPERVIPALLNYNRLAGLQTPAPNPNQAVRYLNFVINNLGSTHPSIHNTLISILAATASSDESALLSYLRNQSNLPQPNYDTDFALRLCIQHDRVRSCVHIYTSMSQYTRAVDLALKHNAIDVASSVADQSTGDNALRKKLWLKVAKSIIANSPGNIKTAIDFLKRCELLRIEDLIPFFPDFVVIDDFKEEICIALEEYSRSIDGLKREMDQAALTATNIQIEIRSLDQRYAIVEPGERCSICRLPLLVKQFFVFPCQHAFHSECLAAKVIELAGMAKAGKIRELQAEVQKSGGKVCESRIKELDGVVASGWYLLFSDAREMIYSLTFISVLCSDMAIKQIDAPFITASDKVDDWAL